MSSVRKIRANRTNALASTGPRTQQGRAKSAQNARRHGLTLPIAASPILSAQAEALAQEIASGSTDPYILAAARQAAATQVDLMRIRRTRHDLLVHNDLSAHCEQDWTRQLLMLDRYERRALSRRKFAIRDLDALMSSPEHS